jgi:ribonuclease HI
MREVGLTEDFIAFVHQSLIGTKVCMKTSVKGRATEYVDMNRAVRQGDPLAPLLFDIVMDGLHRGYTKIGGYQLNNGPRISSVGYCDDTVILASSIEELKKMNEWTCKFFIRHNFNISLDKTVTTGRHIDGSELSAADNILWPQTQVPIIVKKHDQAIRHLGLFLNMNLTWQEQLGAMNGMVQNVATAIRTGRLTLLQGAIITRDSLPQQLEIGLRHAQIPATQLRQWDTAITRAFSLNAGVVHGSLYKGSISAILRTHTIEDHYTIAKATQIMSTLTRNTEALDYHRDRFSDTTSGSDDKDADPDLATDLALLRSKGIDITRNTEACMTPTAPTDSMSSSTLIFSGDMIPVALDTEHDLARTLWGRDYISDPKVWAVIATDGSRLSDGAVGAALVFVDDGLRAHEFRPWAHAWYIPTKADNYVAEMAAINKALRSVPVTVNVRIHTDSLSSIQAIDTFRNSGSQDPMVKCHARPYLRAVAEALHAREHAGAKTEIEHVYSHTGKRDDPSIGNEAADRKAKDGAKGYSRTEDINQLHYELPYIVSLAHPTKRREDGNPLMEPAHGKIRHQVKAHLAEASMDQWAKRPVRGAMARTHRQGVSDIIESVWKNPDSRTLDYIITALNMINHKSDYTTWTTVDCDRCGEGTKADVYHKSCGCPTVHAHFRRAIETIQNTLTKESGPPSAFLDTTDTITHKQWKITRASMDTKKGEHLEVLMGNGSITLMTHRSFEHMGQQHTNEAIITRARRQAETEQEERDNAEREILEIQNQKRATRDEENRIQREHLAARKDAMDTLGIGEQDPDITVRDLAIGETIALQGYDQEAERDDPHPWVAQITSLSKATKTRPEHITVQWMAEIDADRPHSVWELMYKPSGHAFKTQISYKAMAHIFHRQHEWESQQEGKHTMGRTQWQMIQEKKRAHRVIVQTDQNKRLRAKIVRTAKKYKAMPISLALTKQGTTHRQLLETSLAQPVVLAQASLARQTQPTPPTPPARQHDTRSDKAPVEDTPRQLRPMTLADATAIWNELSTPTDPEPTTDIGRAMSNLVSEPPQQMTLRVTGHRQTKHKPMIWGVLVAHTGGKRAHMWYPDPSPRGTVPQMLTKLARANNMNGFTVRDPGNGYEPGWTQGCTAIFWALALKHAGEHRTAQKISELPMPLMNGRSFCRKS